jgi:type I restriction enzyme S subunit
MSANPETAAPTGRTKIAQGKERSDAGVCHESEDTSSPEGAEEMRALPTAWRWAKMSEVCSRVQDGTHFSPKEQARTGDFKYITAKNIKHWGLDLSELTYVQEHVHREIYRRCNVEKGDVLYIKDGVTTGIATVNTLDEEFSLLSSVALLKPHRDILDSLFLKYYLNSPEGFRNMTGQMTGTAIKRLILQKIKAAVVPVAPLPEQRRIVAEIEKQFTRLEAGVAALRRVQANLNRYRAAVLKAACEGRLVPTEAEWPQKQIATAIETMDQGWSPKCESEPSNSNATWAVIKTTAIQNLRFLEAENKTLPPALKPRGHLELAPGDLLVTRAGPRSRVGVACLVKSTRPRLMLCDKAYRLRCKPNVAHPAFLELVLNAPHIVDEVNKLKTGISDSGVNLTQKRFGELLLPLPPLAEQTRIVAEVERRLSVVEELEAVVSANSDKSRVSVLQRATRLRQAILQKAFNGNM